MGGVVARWERWWRGGCCKVVGGNSVLFCGF